MLYGPHTLEFVVQYRYINQFVVIFISFDFSTNFTNFYCGIHIQSSDLFPLMIYFYFLKIAFWQKCCLPATNYIKKTSSYVWIWLFNLNVDRTKINSWFLFNRAPTVGKPQPVQFDQVVNKLPRVGAALYLKSSSPWPITLVQRIRLSKAITDDICFILGSATVDQLHT